MKTMNNRKSLLLLAFIALVLIHTVYLHGNVRDLFHLTAFELVSLSVVISYAIKRRHVNLRKLARLLIHGRQSDVEEIISRFYQYAWIQKELGQLALEKEVMQNPDSFVRRGVLLTIDGISEAELRVILENECKGEQHRYQQAGSMFRLISLLAPGMGLIGTLLGMTGVLESLTHLEQTGANLSSAVVATLYGALLANLFALPCYYRLMDIYDQEMFERRICLEGCICLQRMEHPRVVFEKLNAFLPSDQKLLLVKGAGHGKGKIVSRTAAYAEEGQMEHVG
jgi:chemotaxis protein MotA